MNRTTTHPVSLHRPLSRYAIVASGALVSWWCYQAGQVELATVVLLWGASEF